MTPTFQEVATLLGIWKPELMVLISTPVGQSILMMVACGVMLWFIIGVLPPLPDLVAALVQVVAAIEHMIINIIRTIQGELPL